MRITKPHFPVSARDSSPGFPNFGVVRVEVFPMSRVRRSVRYAVRRFRSSFVWLLPFVLSASGAAARTATTGPTPVTLPCMTQLLNAGFETGDYSGWDIFQTETASESGTHGITGDGESVGPGDSVLDHFSAISVAQTSAGLPITFTATEGKRLGFHLNNDRARYSTSQEIELDPETLSLHWDMMYENHGSSFDPDDMCIRLNIRDSSDDSLIETLFITTTGIDALSVPVMTTYSADISDYAGQKIRIAFEVHAIQDFFDVAFDNFRLDCLPPPTATATATPTASRTPTPTPVPPATPCGPLDLHHRWTPVPAPLPVNGAAFGVSAGMEGNLALVGARNQSVGMISGAGRVYLQDAGTGALVQTFDNPLPEPSDEFGFAVAMRDGLVAVGAPRDNTGAADAGTAYLFDALTGSLLHTFDNPAPATLDFFGAAIAVASNRVLVGAPLDDAGAVDSGTAYLFNALTGTLLHTFNNPARIGNILSNPPKFNKSNEKALG